MIQSGVNCGARPGDFVCGAVGAGSNSAGGVAGVGEGMSTGPEPLVRGTGGLKQPHCSGLVMEGILCAAALKC
jgi:hypothetical protein